MAGWPDINKTFRYPAVSGTQLLFRT